MTLEETARSLCEPRVRHPDFERALLLFNFQVEVLSPEKPKVSSYARLHAAVKFLEYIKSVQDSPSSSPLIKRSALPGYEQNLKGMIEREGGLLSLGRSWSRRQLTDDIDARWSEACDVADMVSFSHRFAQYGDNRKGGITMAP
jgi:hypothetical protein